MAYNKPTPLRAVAACYLALLGCYLAWSASTTPYIWARAGGFANGKIDFQPWCRDFVIRELRKLPRVPDNQQFQCLKAKIDYCNQHKDPINVLCVVTDG